MGKTVKIIFSITIVALLVTLGYFFVARKENISSLTSKLPTHIAFQELGRGCGDFFVYKISTEVPIDDATGISVYAEKDKLNISAIKKTFEVGKTDGLSIEILMGRGVLNEYVGYCANFPFNVKNFKRLVGQSGTATISKSGLSEDNDYTVTVILKDVYFTDDNGNDSDIVIDELIFKNISVGWYPPF